MTDGTGGTGAVSSTMSRVTSAEPPQVPVSPRIGTAERQEAMDALDAHLNAGRLDPDEYGERVGRASVARTVADLEPLFVDLPAPHAPSSVSRSQPGPPPAPASAPWSAPIPASSTPESRGKREPLGGRAGEVAVALSPFIALALFLLTTRVWDEAWVFFLLIPVTGVVVYGKDHDHDDDRDRHRDRRERRNR